MIARNYRRFPEALLYQLELALGDVAETIQAIRVKGGAAWANLVHRYYNAPQDVRGMVPVPEWLRELKKRARALAVRVKSNCLNLTGEKHQVAAPRSYHNVFAMLDAMIIERGGRDNYARPDLCGHTLADIGRYQQCCHIGWNPFVGPFDYSFTYSLEGRFTSEIDESSMPDAVKELPGMTHLVWIAAYGGGIRTLDDLAELTVDELADIAGIDSEQAYTIVKAARAHWFN